MNLCGETLCLKSIKWFIDSYHPTAILDFKYLVDYILLQSYSFHGFGCRKMLLKIVSGAALFIIIHYLVSHYRPYGLTTQNAAPIEIRVNQCKLPQFHHVHGPISPLFDNIHM